MTTLVVKVWSEAALTVVSTRWVGWAPEKARATSMPVSGRRGAGTVELAPGTTTPEHPVAQLVPLTVTVDPAAAAEGLTVMAGGGQAAVAAAVGVPADATSHAVPAMVATAALAARALALWTAPMGLTSAMPGGREYFPPTAHNGGSCYRSVT